MYPEERQTMIVGRARSEGRVEVIALAREFDVTPETIRRDLSALEGTGLLRRVHGGAVVPEVLGLEPSLATREGVNTKAKARIAEAAQAFVPEEGAIALDAGSTTRQFADRLPNGRALTVVTNSLPIASLLAPRSELAVHQVGGVVRGRTLAAVGTSAVAQLSKVFVDVAFLGINGFSVERGLTTPDMAEAAVKSSLIGSARLRVLLADSSKYGRAQFAHVADLGDIDVLVTDSDLSDSAAEQIEAAGTKVVRA